MSLSAASHELPVGAALSGAPPSITTGRKLRECGRCFARGRMPSEQWINNRRGFDISIPRFVVETTAIAKQAGLTPNATGLSVQPFGYPPYILILVIRDRLGH